MFEWLFTVEGWMSLLTLTILEIVLQNGRIVGLRPKGVEIEDFHQPRLMTTGEQAGLMDRFWDSSDIVSQQ